MITLHQLEALRREALTRGMGGDVDIIDIAMMTPYDEVSAAYIEEACDQAEAIRDLYERDHVRSQAAGCLLPEFEGDTEDWEDIEDWEEHLAPY